MVDRDRLMVERAKDIDRILEVNTDTLDNILDSNGKKHESINLILLM
jgi:hypothetical protein